MKSLLILLLRPFPRGNGYSSLRRLSRRILLQKTLPENNAYCSLTLKLGVAHQHISGTETATDLNHTADFFANMWLHLELYCSSRFWKTMATEASDLSSVAIYIALERKQIYTWIKWHILLLICNVIKQWILQLLT